MKGDIGTKGDIGMKGDMQASPAKPTAAKGTGQDRTMATQDADNFDYDITFGKNFCKKWYTMELHNYKFGHKADTDELYRLSKNILTTTTNDVRQYRLDVAFDKSIDNMIFYDMLAQQLPNGNYLHFGSPHVTETVLVKMAKSATDDTMHIVRMQKIRLHCLLTAISIDRAMQDEDNVVLWRLAREKGHTNHNVSMFKTHHAMCKEYTRYSMYFQAALWQMNEYKYVVANDNGYCIKTLAKQVYVLIAQFAFAQDCAKQMGLCMQVDNRHYNYGEGAIVSDSRSICTQHLGHQTCIQLSRQLLQDGVVDVTQIKVVRARQDTQENRQDTNFTVNNAADGLHHGQMGDDILATTRQAEDLLEQAAIRRQTDAGTRFRQSCEVLDNLPADGDDDIMNMTQTD